MNAIRMFVCLSASCLFLLKITLVIYTIRSIRRLLTNIPSAYQAIFPCNSSIEIPCTLAVKNPINISGIAIITDAKNVKSILDVMSEAKRKLSKKRAATVVTDKIMEFGKNVEKVTLLTTEKAHMDIKRNSLIRFFDKNVS